MPVLFFEADEERMNRIPNNLPKIIAIKADVNAPRFSLISSHQNLQTMIAGWKLLNFSQQTHSAHAVASVSVANHLLSQSWAYRNIQEVSQRCTSPNLCSKSHIPPVSCNRTSYIQTLATLRHLQKNKQKLR
jgi:hypothetical protein